MAEREIKYQKGDHHVVSDRSGFTFRKSEMVREPKTGFWVHRSEMDPPHPQLYRTPVKPDRQSVYPVRMNHFGRSPGTGGELPDGTTSTLPEINGGSIDDTAGNFINTNDVDPATFP